MALADFDQLYTAFCELAGLTPRRLSRDANGTCAFTVHVRGLTVSVLEMPEKAPGIAYLLAGFGTMPESAGPPAWCALLQANATVLAARHAAFAAAPSGEIVVQQSVPFDTAAATDVMEHAFEIADLARQWRADPELRDVLQSGLAQGKPYAAVHDDIEFAGVRLEVSGLAPDPHGRASLLARADLRGAIESPEFVRGLLRANFDWMTHANSPAACLGASGRIAMRYVCSLAGGPAVVHAQLVEAARHAERVRLRSFSSTD